MLLTLLRLVLLCVKPLGTYMADVMDGRQNFALRIGSGLELWLYRFCGIETDRDMSWAQYAIALLAFNVGRALIVHGSQRLQFWLPLNPQHLTVVSPDSAFNTAVSFVTILAGLLGT